MFRHFERCDRVGTSRLSIAPNTSQIRRRSCRSKAILFILNHPYIYHLGFALTGAVLITQPSNYVTISYSDGKANMRGEMTWPQVEALFNDPAVTAIELD